MFTLRANVAALAISVAFSGAAMAQSMSKGQYQSEKDGIALQNKSALAACKSLSGNAKDICKAEAAGKEKVAKATLEAKYKPSNQASYKVSLAITDANYSVAKEKCDDLAGNVKDVCLKEAKAAAVAGKADAVAKLKTADANLKAATTTGKANEKADKTAATATKNAVEDKRDADYAVAKERCDAYAKEAKTNCLNDAKARFGKT
jgi:hypothetical protein